MPGGPAWPLAVPMKTASSRTRRARGQTGQRILCVHGVGQQEADPDFASAWRQAVAESLQAAGAAPASAFEFVRYDALFAAAPRNLEVWQRAFGRLLSSGAQSAAQSVQNWLGGLFGQRGPALGQTRGLFDWVSGAREDLQWTAGMVAQWVADDALRAQARAALLADVRRFRPDVVLAHSLGSLIGYDTFARVNGGGAEAIAGRVFVSFGSQINNPFVRDCFGGRLTALPARHWFHLFNRHDDAFTAPIKLPLPNFTQVATNFDIAGMLDHDATAYLRHPETSRVVWRALLAPAAEPLTVAVSAARAAAPEQAQTQAPPELKNLREAIAFSIGSARRTVARRALLVGINEYTRPEWRLEGCVNDVYLMSRRLQEFGFAAENIRIVLNERATADAVRERLEWLFDGCADQQGRVFFFSGHGAQIPGYGVGEIVDRADECLVPHDFDWTPERAVMDNWFYELYSQLPESAHVLSVFDCCHSGGMSRDGGTRVRGLTPPDDIRHRILAWDEQSQTWHHRAGEAPAEPGAVPIAGVGVRRLFRRARAAAAGQPPTWADPAPFGHAGPFMPVLLEACREEELACEHREGAAAYGAFTWSLSQVLSQRRRPKSWGELRNGIERHLQKLRYAQHPALEGPAQVEARPVPWFQT